MNPNNIKEVKIGFSCPKEWEKMSGSDDKRFCEFCNKSVFNFDNLSNDEIINFLVDRNTEKTCAKIEKTQLVKLNQSLNVADSKNYYNPIIFAASLATLTACNTPKQVYEPSHIHKNSNIEIVSNIFNPDSTNTILIKGKIFDDTNHPLIGAQFVLDSTERGCITDFDGAFEFEIKQNEIKSEYASVDYVGFETFQFPLIDVANKEVKITIADDLVLTADDFILVGEVAIIKHPIHKRLWKRVKNLFR